MFLGIPRPRWSLAFVGALIYSLVVITYRLSTGELAVAIALTGALLSRQKFIVPPFLLIYFAYIALAALGALTSPFPDIVLQTSYNDAKLALATLAICAAMQSEEQASFYVYFFVACFLLFPIRGTLVTYLSGQNDDYGRAIWNYVYGDPNDLAALSLLAMGLTLSIARSPRTLPYIRMIAHLAAFSIVTVIVLTKSRGGFIGLIAMFTIPVLKALYQAPSRIIIVLLVIALAIKVIPSSTLDRYAGITKLTSTDTLAEADPEGSAAQRWEIQKTAWRIFTDHPLFGIGNGAYKPANALYSPALGARAPHNTYLEFAAETGLPGLLLWFTANFLVLKPNPRRTEAARSGSYVNSGWIVWAYVGFLVDAFFGTYGGLNLPLLVLAVIYCLDRNYAMTQLRSK